MKKIGLYGGSFDPLHFGHLNLAFELMEKKQLDEVWFIPAHVSPFKTHLPPTCMDDRLNMLHLALDEFPQFKIKDTEFHRPPPSYTIDTLRAFVEEEVLKPTPNQFFLLLGEDSILGFSRWHLPHEIIKLAPLLIGNRSGKWHSEYAIEDQVIKKAVQKGLIQTRLMDISSTNCRERLSKNLYCGHLMPAQLIEYIKQNEIYQLK